LVREREEVSPPDQLAKAIQFVAMSLSHDLASVEPQAAQRPRRAIPSKRQHVLQKLRDIEDVEVVVTPAETLGNGLAAG
jgi:hypothetical protein